MKKLLLGMGYLTWLICNLGILYAIGVGVQHLFEVKSVGVLIFELCAGMVVILLLIILSILLLGIVALMFGDDKMENYLIKTFPFMKA